MLRTPLFALVLLVLPACEPERIGAPEPDAAFTARAVGFLDGLQGPSFEEDREYCGYFGYGDSGEFVATGPDVGGMDYCETVLPRDFDVVASYHTHGAHGTEHIAEVPSPEDVETDMAEGVFGYVSTPGGRVWLIDWRTGTATQVCGVSCVTQDPRFNAREIGPVRRVYTRELLTEKFGY